MKNNKLVNIFFSLSLLLVFVICALLLVSIQINAYEKVNNDNEKVNYMHTPISYISNKVRSYDSLNCINVSDDNILLLSDEYSEYYIYEDQGYLKEINASKNYEFKKSDGNKLFKIKSFKVEIRNEKLVLNIDDQEFILSIRSKVGS